MTLFYTDEDHTMYISAYNMLQQWQLDTEDFPECWVIS